MEYDYDKLKLVYKIQVLVYHNEKQGQKSWGGDTKWAYVSPLSTFYSVCPIVRIAQ
jgi:hypothetical protein